MMNTIEVLVSHRKVGDLFYEKETNSYGFNYTVHLKPISLIMPYRSSTYLWKNKLHPVFDMYVPEGYLFEIFKKYLSKEYGYIDDYLIFSYICQNIQSRLTYKSHRNKENFVSYDLDEILHNDTQDTFMKLLETFLHKNAISGIQPKSLATLRDKESVSTKEYIIKTWADEYPQLALNEYFCLKAVEEAGVKIPNIQLSKNNKFLLVERFNYDKHSESFLGFEEILVLLGKNKDEKYSGSYETVAKTVYAVTTNKQGSMSSLYKVIVMNYLLKNGDAHLKNFGILYDEGFENIYFSPAYDIVNTVVYMYKDKPALTMFGNKSWHGKKELVKFGVKHCYLSQSEATMYYEECLVSVKSTIQKIENYIQENEEFNDIGSKIIDCLKLSCEEISYKEMPLETTRAWSKNKDS